MRDSLRAVGRRVMKKEDAMLCQRCSGLLICEYFGELRDEIIVVLGKEN